ncbi:hypothetical protein RUND412_003499 [Rhizina undulata]
MSRYYASSLNHAAASYRYTNGSLNVHHPYIIERPASPTGSCCSAFSEEEDTSLPLNTPWSSTPTSSVGSLASTHSHHRPYSVSEHHDQRKAPIVINHHQSRPHSPPRMGGARRSTSTNVDGREHYPERTREGREYIMDRTRERREYIADGTREGRGMTEWENTPRIIVPASSERSRRRDHSRSTSVYRNIEREREIERPRYGTEAAGPTYRTSHEFRPSSTHSLSPTDGVRLGEKLGKGMTRFPLDLLSREAAEGCEYPWEEDSTGRIIIHRALEKAEINKLIEWNKRVKRERNTDKRSGNKLRERPKFVSFDSTTIIHDLPSPPPPTPPIDCIPALLTDSNLSHYTSLHTPSPPKTTYARLHPPAPAVPVSAVTKQQRIEIAPRSTSVLSSSDKLAEAEEKAIRRERRAKETRKKEDIEKAAKAWETVEALKRKVEEKEVRREVRRDDTRGMKHSARRSGELVVKG